MDVPQVHQPVNPAQADGQFADLAADTGCCSLRTGRAVLNANGQIVASNRHWWSRLWAWLAPASDQTRTENRQVGAFYHQVLVHRYGQRIGDQLRDSMLTDQVVGGKALGGRRMAEVDKQGLRLLTAAKRQNEATLATFLDPQAIHLKIQALHAQVDGAKPPPASRATLRAVRQRALQDLRALPDFGKVQVGEQQYEDIVNQAVVKHLNAVTIDRLARHYAFREGFGEAMQAAVQGIAAFGVPANQIRLPSTADLKGLSTRINDYIRRRDVPSAAGIGGDAKLLWRKALVSTNAELIARHVMTAERLQAQVPQDRADLPIGDGDVENARARMTAFLSSSSNALTGQTIRHMATLAVYDKLVFQENWRATAQEEIQRLNDQRPAEAPLLPSDDATIRAIESRLRHPKIEIQREHLAHLDPQAVVRGAVRAHFAQFDGNEELSQNVTRACTQGLQELVHEALQNPNNLPAQFERDAARERITVGEATIEQDPQQIQAYRDLMQQQDMGDFIVPAAAVMNQTTYAVLGSRADTFPSGPDKTTDITVTRGQAENTIHLRAAFEIYPEQSTAPVVVVPTPFGIISYRRNEAAQDARLTQKVTFNFDIRRDNQNFLIENVQVRHEFSSAGYTPAPLPPPENRG